MAGCAHVEMDRDEVLPHRDATATPRDLRQSPVRILSVVKPTFLSLESAVCRDAVTVS
jgi:hypothetical protein